MTERTLLAWSRFRVIRDFILSVIGQQMNPDQLHGAVFEVDMTSQERHELRYQRRKAKRDQKKYRRENQDYDLIFSYEHLYSAYLKCRRNVAWKASTQNYIAQAPLNVYHTFDILKREKFKTLGFHEFDLYERGKHRHIRSVHMKERVVQRCLCDQCLTPMLTRAFVYDNGASMENKGYTFAIRRMIRHLQYHYRKHGTEGYILLFDFSKFFESISHDVVKKILEDRLCDDRVKRLTFHLIDAFGDGGLGLGSQISQLLALISCNSLDHYVKEKLRIRGYGRYMDDGYLIHESKQYLQECLKEIKAICEELHVNLNLKKTQIVKISRGFTYLKTRFFLLPTGQVVRKIYKRSVTKMRQKLKKLRKLLTAGKVTITDVMASWNSWRSYALTFSAWHTVQNMQELFYQLFESEVMAHVL